MRVFTTAFLAALLLVACSQGGPESAPVELALSAVDSVSRDHEPAPIAATYERYKGVRIATEGVRLGPGLPSGLGSHQYVGLHEPTTPGAEFRVLLSDNVPPLHGSRYRVVGRIVPAGGSYEIAVEDWEELASLALPVSAGSTNTAVREAINRTCVSSTEMVLAGIRLGDPRAMVEARLGSPDPEGESSGLLEYPGLSVRLHASRAQSVLATSFDWSTPSGIQAGLSPTEAGEILGFDLDAIQSPHKRTPRRYLIHRCIESQEQTDVEAYLGLALSDDGSIAEVEIFWVAP